MRLLSLDGASVCLRPVGYEFGQPPGGAAEGDADDWYADWLMIRGDASTADGQAWTFTDPCLSTGEAADLSAWLWAAASQDLPAGFNSDEMFTEPNLHFTLDAHDGERVRVRVRFSHESLPTWLPGNGPRWRDGAGYSLRLRMSRADLAEAARAWDRDCQQFPPRVPAPGARSVARHERFTRPWK